MKKYIKLYKLRNKGSHIWDGLSDSRDIDFINAVQHSENNTIGITYTKEMLIKHYDLFEEWEAYPIYVVMASNKPITLEELKNSKE